MAGFWRRHRRKIFVAVGVLGCGYALYKMYDVSRQRAIDSERESEGHRRADEIIKAQLQSHFENIQAISETTTLPYAMQYLRSRVAEELDLSHLTEKLMQGKGQSNALQPKEKLELWERLKILSFARTATSLWTMTTLFLYVRIQVNILGRHLYLETARGLGALEESEELDQFDRQSQQDFLATADYLCNHGISNLIFNMQNAASEVVKDKQLRDPFSMAQMRDTILQILELFMSGNATPSWVTYMLPENAKAYQHMLSSSSSSFEIASTNKLEELIAEAQSVLSSTEFRNIMDLSLTKVVDGLIEDLQIQFGGAMPSGIPLAKFLPRIVQLAPLSLEEPSNNKYIAIIRGLPEVELFYTLLYANATQGYATASS